MTNPCTLSRRQSSSDAQKRGKLRVGEAPHKTMTLIITGSVLSGDGGVNVSYNGGIDCGNIGDSVCTYAPLKAATTGERKCRRPAADMASLVPPATKGRCVRHPHRHLKMKRCLGKGGRSST